MADPLAEVVGRLQPVARLSKVVTGAGAWRIRRSEVGDPFYCALLEGATRLTVDGRAPIDLAAGDFVLIPSLQDFTMASRLDEPAQNPATEPVQLADGEFRIGDPARKTDCVMLVGHCAFASPDAALLVSLLPETVQVSGDARLATLVRWVGEESRARRPARDVVLSHLLEILFIEALRSTAAVSTAPGLLRGLADTRLARALRVLHANPGRCWTVGALAEAAGLSRSAFFARFSDHLGVSPMAYLLAWRMALAKTLLEREGQAVADVAERVGYGSASAFSVAFSRHVGQPPARYAAQGSARGPSRHAASTGGPFPRTGISALV